MENTELEKRDETHFGLAVYRFTVQKIRRPKEK